MGIGAKAVWDSASKVKIGEAGKVSSIGGIEFTGELIGDLSQSGAGGLDIGSEAAGTWYAVYVIDGDSVSPAVLLSASFVSPTLPSGYDKKVFVWAVKNDDAGDLMCFVQTGKGMKRRCWYDVGTENLRVAYNANATAWTEADCSVFVPPVCDLVHMQVKFETGKNGAAADDTRVRAKGMSNSAISPSVGVVSKAKAVWQVSCPCDDDQKVEYKVDDGSDGANEVTIVVRGWDLDL
jgi:hypothetical protein